MSLIEAYQCDHCRKIKEAAEVVGISPQADLFHPLDGFPIIPVASKAIIHLCTECYNAHAATPADNEVNRRRNESAYKEKLKELSFSLRQQCVTNYNAEKTKEKIRKKVARVK